MELRWSAWVGRALLLAVVACGSRSTDWGPDGPGQSAGAGASAASGAPVDREQRIEALCQRYTRAYCDDDGQKQIPFDDLPRGQQDEIAAECRELLDRRSDEILDQVEECLGCEPDCVAIDGCLTAQPHGCDEPRAEDPSP